MPVSNGQFQKGYEPWNKGKCISGMSGKRHSDVSKNKIGEANKKENPKSNPNELLRKSAKHREWRTDVFERDSYTCQECGVNKHENSSVILHPHHIKSFEKYPEDRFKVENGQTLCSKCHGKIHNINYAGLGKMLHCPICGKEFRPKNGHYDQATCSRKCGYEYRKRKPSGKLGKHYPHLQKGGKAKRIGSPVRGQAHKVLPRV